MIAPKLLKRHPRHGHYHTSFAEMPELYGYIKEDILTNGIVTPLLVQAKTNVIMDGHMRYEIALDLNMAEVPVRLSNAGDEEAELALVDENRKRQSQERDPIRIARQIALLKDAKGLSNGRHSNSDKLTMDEMAKELGLKSRQLYKYLRLIRLTPEFQRFVSMGLLGIKSAVDISYLPWEDQKYFYELVTRTGAPKIALGKNIVSEWIAEYRENKRREIGTTFFKEDQAIVNQLDVTTDAIDRRYDAEDVVGTDKLLRQSIVMLAEALPDESGARFERAVAEKNLQKHLISLKRMEAGVMGIVLPDSVSESELLDEMTEVLNRIMYKLQEVQKVLKEAK